MHLVAHAVRPSPPTPQTNPHLLGLGCCLLLGTQGCYSAHVVFELAFLIGMALVFALPGEVELAVPAFVEGDEEA